MTVVIAAWNEEAAIVPTLERIAGLTYRGALEVVLADNNSTDRTAELAEAARGGSASTIGASSSPSRESIARSTRCSRRRDPARGHRRRRHLSPARGAHLSGRARDATPQDQHVCACAGALVVENPDANFLTRMQQWDYRLGINGVKRMQAAYNSALVAQGAFSAYWTEDVRAVGGWPDAIGEDIVLTWTMMDSRGIVQYEPLALGSTDVPERLATSCASARAGRAACSRDRAAHPPQTQPRVLAKFVAGIDYLVPFLDIGFVFFWIPGLILFILGYPLIFSGGRC